MDFYSIFLYLLLWGWIKICYFVTSLLRVEMKRKIYEKLLEWKADSDRKPLILQGARQVGKSWILKEFGRNEYKNMAYISCDNEPLAPALFADYDTDRIIRSVEAITKVPVVKDDTLIIFDEIQEVPAGLQALKYLCENKRGFHVAVAGSLLGITLNSGISFPVGKVDFLQMYPMDFEEFLLAAGEMEIAELIRNADKDIVNTVHEKCISLLRQYYFTGGMPESVFAYITGKGVLKVREIQKALLTAYKNDISKHAPKREVERIRLVLESLPAQLAKENKKFIFSAVRKGARAADFEIAIQWLADAGIVNKVNRISIPKLPLSFYEDFNAFKLYLLDCGLYGAMVDADPSEILMGSNLYEQYKGSFTESYALQQLICDIDRKVYYYSADNSRMEVDFIIKFNKTAVPIEVKAEDNVKSKSLGNFRDSNRLPLGIRFSMRAYREQEKLVNIPLYAIFSFPTWLE